MASVSSRLIVSLIDGVSAPARGVARSLLGIPKAVRGADGVVPSFATRLNQAMEQNARAMDAARGRMVDAMVGAYALAGGMRVTLGAAMGLEDKMADIAKVSGMSGDELKGFEMRLRDLARGEIPMAVEELAELAAAASQSGIANDDLEGFTRMVAKAAVAWEVSGGEAGEALAKIKTALGLTIEETQRYADVINYLSDSTASSAPDLIDFSRRVAADGKVAGFANEEVLALGAAMISAGAQADVAATSLRNVGRMLSRGDFGAKKSQLEAFEKLGMDAEKVAKAMQIDASGTLITVLEAIDKQEPHKKLALMSGIFGDEARALMPLLGQLEQTRGIIKNVGDDTNYLGSVQKEFAARSETGSYALQRFKNQMSDIGITIGQSFLPAMKEILEIMSPILLAFGDWVREHPKIVAAVLGIAGAFVALKVGLAGLTFLGLLGRGGALSLLAGGMSLLGRSAAGVGQAADALDRVNRSAQAASRLPIPALWGKGAIAGLGAAGLISEMSRPDAMERGAARGASWNKWLEENIGSPRSWFGFDQGETNKATAEVADIERQISAQTQGWVSAATEGLRGYVAAIANGGSEAEAEASAIAAQIEDALTVQGKLTIDTSQLQTALSLARQAGEAIRSGRVDGERAKGGPVTAGQSYLVGERGPEIITPSKGGYVHPNGAKVGGAGGGSITVAPVFNFNGTPRETADEIARKAMAVIERETRALMGGLMSDTGLRAGQ